MKKLENSIKYGDIFEIEGHLLMNGDARDKKLVNGFLENKKIKLILSDIPYGISFVASKISFNQKIAKPKDIVGDQLQSDEEYRKFNKDWLEIAIPYLDKKNAFYIFNCDKMIFALREGLKDAGYNFSQLLVWIKNQPVLGRKDYLPMSELIAYGWHGTHEFRRSKSKSVLFYPKPQKSMLHPTMKPIGLLRELILNSTRIGDWIYDPFSGSGSTGLACEQTQRKSLMIEIDPEYCQTIINRFEKIFNKKAVLIRKEVQNDK